MGKRSTFAGYIRQRGATSASSSSLTGPSPAVVPAVLAITGLDATLGATINTGKYLPVGAIVLAVAIVGGGTGGTSPLVDVGLALGTPDPDGLVDGAAVGANSNNGIGDTNAGVLLGTALTEDAEITVADGGGTNATGGTLDVYITYTFDDDGSIAN